VYGSVLSNIQIQHKGDESPQNKSSEAAMEVITNPFISLILLLFNYS
jgi:hypothetical protein